jgi:hypothetical protein
MYGIKTKIGRLIRGLFALVGLFVAYLIYRHFGIVWAAGTFVVCDFFGAGVAILVERRAMIEEDGNAKEPESDSGPRISAWVRGLAWLIVGFWTFGIGAIVQELWHSGMAAFNWKGLGPAVALMVLVFPPIVYAAITGRAPRWRGARGSRLSDPVLWKPFWRRKD